MKIIRSTVVILALVVGALVAAVTVNAASVTEAMREIVHIQ